MSEQSSPVVIFVLGGPGAGKGTQCANLVKDFSFVHLSAGDLLRAEMAREGSEFGELISTYIKEGQIVSMEVTLKLIQQAMAQSPGSMVLLDGFPRKMDQALEFEKAVAPCKAVLYFTCTEEAMLERLLKRGETSGRSDDNKESIVKRFQTFHETSFPVIQHYQAENKVIEIDTLDTPDNVYLATKTQIQKLLGISSQDEAPVAAAEPESIPEPASIPETQETSEGIVSDTSATSDSMLPEIQVGNNSNLSEVLEQLNIDPQPEAVEESSPVTEEASKKDQAPTSEEKAAPVEQQTEPKVEAAPVQAPVVTEPESVTKSPVSEIEIVEDTIPKLDAPTSSKDAAPAQNASTETSSQAPAQPASPGPASPKSTKSHSKKKSNCLVM